MPQPSPDVLSRRKLLLAAACVTAPPALTACSQGDAEQDAARALRTPWAQFSGTANPPRHDLIRQATLALSSYNRQCWRIQLAQKSIAIAPDLTRRCPVVDPDDHHLFVSLGCATENLVHAALATGLHADARFDPAGDGAVVVSLAPTQKRVSPLFQALAERQCTRGDYDGRPISPAELRQPEQAGTGDGVSVRLPVSSLPRFRSCARIPPGGSRWHRSSARPRPDRSSCRPANAPAQADEPRSSRRCPWL